MKVLRQISKGKKQDYSINAVIAKYLINKETEKIRSGSGAELWKYFQRQFFFKTQKD